MTGNEPESLSRLQDRYIAFMDQPRIRDFVRGGGTVTVAAEGRTQAEIAALARAGHRHFAEKFVQEALVKIPVIQVSHPEVRWHYFGRLQRDKTKRVLASFQVIETLSRPREARRLQRLQSDDQPAPAILVQLNLGREPQKNGALPEQAPALIEEALEAGLSLKGLMTIPPKRDPPLPYFRAVREMADSYGLPWCQMGFSADYEQAIDAGATHIRIGRRIFAPDAGWYTCNA